MPGRTLSADEVRQLYDQHGRALLAYACAFFMDVAAAEDVLHQVFLRLLRRPTAVPDAPLAHLYRAVRNAALNARRDGFSTNFSPGIRVHCLKWAVANGAVASLRQPPSCCLWLPPCGSH